MIPALQDVGAARRVLPYGRYLTTFEEIASRYVPANDQNRSDIWDSFLQSVETAKTTFGSVVGVWIGGSFITSEENPHDIDVVFLVQDEAYQYAMSSNKGRFFVRLLLQGEIERVDSFLMKVPPTDIGDSEYAYLRLRGYWDQFWSKTRFEEGNDRWLYPASGYLQVVIDGYDS